jgi:thiamine biosynthesis lipoprotein
VIGAVAPVSDGQAERLAVDAMATRFELVCWGPRAAGEGALQEIVRLEAQLSAYRASSVISWINAHAHDRAVKVEPGTFALLQRCVELSEKTDGAFDITVGPLLKAWRFVGETDALPSPGLVADARARVGHEHLRLDPDASTIRFGRAGMRLDLGAAGKGFAIDAAMAVLASHGVERALLHGGTSSVHALGAPPEGPWRIGWAGGGGQRRTFTLRDSALSVSAVHGRSFGSDGRVCGHVPDPRLGVPVESAESAVVTGPRSLECDVLSTALLVLGAAWLPTLRRRFPGYDGATDSHG